MALGHSAELLTRATIARLKRIQRSRPLWCWGTGTLGRRIVGALNAAGVPVAAFIDSNPINCGTRVTELDVLAPASLGVVRPGGRPFVLLASMYADEILPVLKSYGLKPTQDVLRLDSPDASVPVPESRFTLPRPDCPHPEWWHSYDSDATEIETIDAVAALISALQPELVVETGAHRGFMARAIGRALRKNKHGRLISLDVDPRRCREARVRCHGLPVTILEQSSLDFTPPGPVGFAWFDSLPELRVPEFRRYHSSLGSMVGFHDTGPQHPLRPGIEQLAAEGLLRPIFFDTPRGFCLAEVLKPNRQP